MNTLTHYLAYNLSRELRLRGMSQVELADRCGSSQPRLSSVLAARSNVSLGLIERISRVLEVPASVLIARPCDTPAWREFQKAVSKRKKR